MARQNADGRLTVAGLEQLAQGDAGRRRATPAEPISGRAGKYPLSGAFQFTYLIRPFRGRAVPFRVSCFPVRMGKTCQSHRTYRRLRSDPVTTTEWYDLILRVSGQEGLTGLVKQATEAKASLDRLTEAGAAVEKKSIDLNSLAAGGRGLFSAWQSGEIGQIAHGIGDLVGLVPGLGLYGAAIGKIGDVAAVAWPALKDLYQTFTAQPEKVVEATKAIEDYGTRINELGESVENLTNRKASLNAQLERENKGLAEAATWAEKAAKLQAQDNGSGKEAEEERAGNLQSVLGGTYEDVVESLAVAMAKKELDELRAELPGKDRDLRERRAGGEDVRDEATALAGQYDRAQELARVTASEEEQAETALRAQQAADDAERRVKNMLLAGQQPTAADFAGVAWTREQLGKQSHGIPQDIQDAARKAADAAVIGGKEDAIRTIAGMLPDQKAFGRELPESKAAEAAADEAEEEATEAWRVKRRARDAAAKAQARESAEMGRVADQVSAQLDAQRQREARDAAQAEKQIQADVARIEHDRPQQQAEQSVRQMAGFNGLQLTPSQVTAAAHEALGSVEQGIQTNQAIMGAILSVAQRSAALSARLAEQEMKARNLALQMNGLFMSSDNSGLFSLLPNLP